MTRPELGSPALRRVLRGSMPADMAACLPPEAPPIRAAAGKAAKRHGSALESWLSAQHKAAALGGLAHVRKVGAPVIVGARGLPTGWAGTGPADFQGVLASGRAVAVEAKSQESRLALSDVAVHQREDLQRVGELGGLALLVVELRKVGSIYVVPWDRITWRRMREGAADVSVGPNELALWRWTGGCYLAPWIAGGR